MANDARNGRGLQAVDRISNLPENIIHLFLQRLSTHDAVRTTVLSKTWRNIWGMHPKLYLDQNFISQLVSQKFFHLDEQTKINKVSRTISNILLAHNGPILNFVLFIPRDLPFHQSTDMVLWIKNISNNGVRELKLRNESLHACTVPSHLFSCSQLTRLTLVSCILNPPLGFGGFCNLVMVELEHVLINADMLFGTRLEELNMYFCIGIEHLGSQFRCENNLIKLSIGNCEEIDWKWFEYTQKLLTLSLWMHFEMPSSGKEVISLDKLVCNMPRIRSLYLDGFYLKILEPGAAILKRLTRATENLRFLKLHNIKLHDLVQIQPVLCLIRSSPNLQVLNIDLDHEVQSSDGVELSDLMALSDYMILDKLETILIFYLVGSLAEFQFIKLLLALSPSLKQINLKMEDTGIDNSTEELRISREVSQIPRASKSAQIRWM
ncbi:F-box/FBD/LRR-repeat protein At1g13570-like [Apium graveolens]|uniref:F-box/FBD/LRR-repeat protein At1g13570-like n=1 Tax=Apium graveolens TaxID=4045 RepID=UPI003D7936F6